MKRFHFLSLFFGALAVLSTGCDAISGKDDGGGTVQLTGQVLNAETNNPVPDAVVRIAPYGLIFEVDEDGRFMGSVDVDSTMNLQVTASSSGFAETTVPVLAIAGRTIAVPPLRLSQTSLPPAQSGRASNIILASQSAQSIGVKESGSDEVAQITFQVADSMGRPVTLDQAITVSFRFGARPNGNEFLFPTTAKTDNNGRVTVSVSAGTRAGVLQVIAEANMNGTLVRSMPVALAIHGGLPVQQRFTLAAEKYNFPGLVRYGEQNAISVILGDQYGNPVKPGTATYFTTTHGVIEGSVLTDESGGGSVNLMSAEPLPSLSGVAIVTATTGDQNQNAISKQIPVLFSGVPQINLSPATPALGQAYTLKITDPLGNPLAEGTQVTVVAEGENVKAVGSASFTVPETIFDIDPNADGNWNDTRAITGLGHTEWNFSIVKDQQFDDSGNPLSASVSTITVSVSGPNGSLQYTFGGAAKTGASNAIVIAEPDGSTTVRYSKD